MNKNFTIGIVTGAVIGALAGVLMAPKSGKDTREDIKKFVEDTKNKVAEKASAAIDLTRAQYNRIVDVAVDEGSKVLDVTREDLAELKRDLKDRYESVKVRLSS